MRIAGRVFCQTSCILALLLIVSIGSVAAEGRFQDLSLETRTLRARILPWEVLRIEVVLRNDTGDEVSGFGSWGYLRLYLARGSQPFELLKPRFFHTTVCVGFFRH